MQKLSEKEQIIFKRLTNVSERIELTYKNLENLEISNKKNTKDYQSEVNRLKELISLELDYYSEEIATEENYINILNKTEQENIKIPTRMKNRLEEIRKDYECKQEIEEDYTQDDMNIFYNLGYIEPDYIYKTIRNEVTLKNNLSKILIKEQELLALYYLENMIEHDNQKQRNFLIKTKYEDIKNYSLEDRFFFTNFEIEKPEILSNSNLSFFLGVAESDIEKNKEDILERQIEKMIITIANTPDYYYDEIAVYLLITKLKSILKATLELTDDKTAQCAYNTTVKYLKSNDYSMTHPTNSISKGVIIDIMKERKNNCKEKMSVREKALGKSYQ